MEKSTTHATSTVTVTQVDVAGAKKAPGAAQAAQGSGLPDFGVLWRRVRRHLWLVLVTVALGVPIAKKVSTLKTPGYKSEATVTYRGGVNGDPSMELLKGLSAKIKEGAVSQATLRRLIDDCHLQPQLAQAGAYDAIYGMIKPKIETKSKGADTFTISFEGASAEEAQRVAQRLADALVEDSTKLRTERAKYTIDFLEAEMRRADENVESAEKAITVFMTEHPDFATDNKGTGTTIRAEQKASALAQKKAQQRMLARKKATGRGDGAFRRGFAPPAPAAAIGPAVDPMLLQTMKATQAELAAARKDLAEKSLKFTEQHPDVRAASARVALAETASRNAEADVAAAQPPATPPLLGSPVEVADPYEDPSASASAPLPVAPPDPSASAEVKPRAHQGEESENVVVEAEWSRLNRELNSARSFRGSIETKLQTAEMTANSEVSGYAAQLVVLDPASLPSSPTGTPPGLVFNLGLGVAAALGFLLAVVRGVLLDDRVFAASEVDALGLVPVLGVIPKPKGKKKRSWLESLRE